MNKTELFHGVVVAIEEKIKTKNYSFVLERNVTLKDEEEIQFLITNETQMMHGSYFELGDTLEIEYDVKPMFPYNIPPIYPAIAMKIVKVGGELKINECE